MFIDKLLIFTKMLIARNSSKIVDSIIIKRDLKVVVHDLLNFI